MAGHDDAHIPITEALRKLRQEDGKFQTSLAYTMRILKVLYC